MSMYFDCFSARTNLCGDGARFFLVKTEKITEEKEANEKRGKKQKPKQTGTRRGIYIFDSLENILNTIERKEKEHILTERERERKRAKEKSKQLLTLKNSSTIDNFGLCSWCTCGASDNSTWAIFGKQNWR